MGHSPCSGGFTVQMTDQAGMVRGDDGTGQGHPTPIIRLAQERLSGGGASRTTGDKRAGMSQARGASGALTANLSKQWRMSWQRSPGKGSPLSWPESLHFHSALGGTPKGISWHLFVLRPLPRGCLAQNAISCPLFGFYSSISLPIGSYPLFMGECF